MSGFVSIDSPVGSAADALPVDHGQLCTQVFWPTIDLADLREATRLDSTVSPARLVTAAQSAVLSVNAELKDWRAAQEALGYTTLEQVPGERLGTESTQTLLYRRAVYASTEANLRERYRDLDTSPKGHEAADRHALPIEDLRRDARWAVRDLLGRPRSTIELI